MIHLERGEGAVDTRLGQQSIPIGRLNRQGGRPNISATINTILIMGLGALGASFGVASPNRTSARPGGISDTQSPQVTVEVRRANGGYTTRRASNGP